MNVKNFGSIKKDDDTFFYLGVPISKEYFTKEKIADVCNKLNEIKHQLLQEPTISKIHSDNKITNLISFICLERRIDIICSIEKDFYIGLYQRDKKEFLKITPDILNEMNDDIIYALSNQLNRTANKIKMGLIEETTIKDQELLQKWDTYINNLKKLPNNFQYTYQVCFTCNLGKIITSDEELRQAIKRKELLIREEKEGVESRE